MPSVIVDGKEIEISPSERLNGIEIARRAGVEIPHYCWHPGLSVVASCRMCLCETGTRNPETGAITMMPKLVPACQTPAKADTVFVTDSEKIRQARAYVEEALLIDHPIDCPICDKAGECLLQDYYFLHGQKERRADLRPFTSQKRPMGETVTLFVDRCVMCTRCVRFTREITGTSELMVTNRGSHEEIDVMPGFPLDNKLAGNVVDICPVGALGDKDFLYSQRVWFMKRHAGVCAGCSTGCSINIEENQDRVYRLKPRENAAINQWWMCDEGRYGFHHLHADSRLVGAKHRNAKGELANQEWSEMRVEIDAAFKKAGRLAGVLSPHLTVEEAYLLATYLRSIDPQAVLALGPVPVDGTDERFPNGFTIHAEKCPNRRGVEAVLKHFAGTVTTFDDFVKSLPSSDVRAAWVSGGYKTDWNTAEQAAAFAGLDVLVVQDMFSSPLLEQATHQLPGAGFAERAGSYVNHGDRLQSFAWAIRPPAGAWVEGQVYWQLLARPGLFNSRAVLSDVAAEILYFEPAGAEIGETGVDLRAKLLAEAKV
jgi:NADH-quinone oxidoreductase subunit G